MLVLPGGPACFNQQSRGAGVDILVEHGKYNYVQDFIMTYILDSGVIEHPTWTGGIMVKIALFNP